MKQTPFHFATYLWLTVVLLLHPSAISGQPAQSAKTPIVDSQMRRRLVDAIVHELEIKYVAPERAKEIGSYLRSKLQTGAYDKLDNPRQLAAAFTEDLRAVSKDSHLWVAYDPTLERALLTTPQTPSVDLLELPPTSDQLAGWRRSNFGFHSVEIMSGNVGYIELRGFVDVNYSKETAVAAMSFVANSDAVIIDLRKNPGGFVNTENFLASYFYGVDPVELLSRYHRDSDVTVKDWTLREVRGKRMPNVDLFILTSGETASAGEGFSFILQQRKRAKIVGEKTAGAGYGNKETPIGDGFVFFVSIFRQFDSRTGQGWQGVGVIPDIAVPADRALSVAHSLAIKSLAERTTDERRKQQLTWLAPLLDLEAYGPKPVEASVLESYTGKYDGGKIVISIDQGQLYFLGASGVRRRMLPLADDSFLIEDSSVPPEDQARTRFVKDAAGVVTELRLLVADGRTFPRAKDPK
jgi:retinol-binding protein 3